MPPLPPPPPPPAGFRGVSAEQDSRFANKEKKLLKVCGALVCQAPQWRSGS